MTIDDKQSELDDAPRSRKRRQLTPPPAPAAYTIDEFCVAHRFSRAMYYKVKARGEGPRTMTVGTKELITNEAAAEWRRQREALASVAA